MSNKNIMTGFAVVMLVYQGWRVFDYMGSSLQDVNAAVRLIVSLAFLSFSELGLLTWLHAARPHATTNTQEWVSAVMIWADFVGSMVVGLGDLARHNTIYAMDLTSIEPLLFLAPWVLVVLNIAGYLIFTMADSEAQLDREERRLQHAEHTLEMAAKTEAIRELSLSKKAIGEKLAPSYYGHILERVTGRTLARFERQAKSQAAAASIESLPHLPNPNGKVIFNNEIDQADEVNPTKPANAGKED